MSTLKDNKFNVLLTFILYSVVRQRFHDTYLYHRFILFFIFLLLKTNSPTPRQLYDIPYLVDNVF